MTLTRGFIRNAVTTPLDARLMDMAGVICNADGSPRTGVLGGANASIVATTATMNLAVSAAEFVTSKGKADGVAIFTNDGVVNVAVAAAPVSNSRIDVLWVKHNDNTTGDADSLPVFGVTAGVAGAVPAKPAIPTGALELATLRIYSGTTATNGGANVLTNTYQMTAARGSVVPFRTKTDLDLWTTAPTGQLALTQNEGRHYRYSGTSWRPLSPVEIIRPTSVLGTGATINADGSVSFAAAAAISLNGVFAADIENYTILIDLDSSSAPVYARMRLRASGTDLATGSYSEYYTIHASAAPVHDYSVTRTSVILGYVDNTGLSKGHITAEISGPARVGHTWTPILSRGVGQDRMVLSGGGARVATLFDGFTIFPDSGTFTGRIRVYANVGG